MIVPGRPGPARRSDVLNSAWSRIVSPAGWVKSEAVASSRPRPDSEVTVVGRRLCECWPKHGWERLQRVGMASIMSWIAWVSLRMGSGSVPIAMWPAPSTTR